MSFKVTKTFKPIKNIHPVLVTLLWVVAIPIFILVLLIGIVSLTFHNIKKLFVKEPRLSQEQIDRLKEIKYTLNNGSVTLELYEDKFDQYYAQTCDRWYADVYDEDNFVYKVRTTPFIPELDGKVVTSFIKETKQGAFLQIVENVNKVEEIMTSLMLLTYGDLKLTPVEEVGPYFLYVDKTNPNLIKGFNRKGDIELSLTKNGM